MTVAELVENPLSRDDSRFGSSLGRDFGRPISKLPD
jgi:hypothetical protein